MVRTKNGNEEKALEFLIRALKITQNAKVSGLSITYTTTQPLMTTK